MMDIMAPHVYGQSLAGAGGGGFMYVISKEPGQGSFLRSLVSKEMDDDIITNEIKFCEALIDEVGLVIPVD